VHILSTDFKPKVSILEVHYTMSQYIILIFNLSLIEWEMIYTKNCTQIVFINKFNTVLNSLHDKWYE